MNVSVLSVLVVSDHTEEAVSMACHRVQVDKVYLNIFNTYTSSVILVILSALHDAHPRIFTL